jgi:hypothetical protein
MTQAVIQARQGLLLTTSTILALVLLVLVTAIGVSVGERSSRQQCFLCTHQPTWPDRSAAQPHL